MRKIIFVLLMLIIGTSQLPAQFGIGASGGMLYPGFSSSEFYNSKFGAGAGYDFFIRHRLLKISKDQQIDARYSISKYFSDIKLPLSGTMRFFFNYLSVDVQTEIKSFQSLKLNGGAGLSLVSVKSPEDYYNDDVNETLIIPNINTAVEYWFSDNFNIFLNIYFQFGEFNARGDKLRVHGLRLVSGGTMFLTK